MHTSLSEPLTKNMDRYQTFWSGAQPSASVEECSEIERKREEGVYISPSIKRRVDRGGRGGVLGSKFRFVGMECVLFVCVRVKECVCLRHILSASKCSLACECINHTVTASKKMTLSKKVSLSTVTQHGNQTIAN